LQENNRPGKSQSGLQAAASLEQILRDGESIPTPQHFNQIPTAYPAYGQNHYPRKPEGHQQIYPVKGYWRLQNCGAIAVDAGNGGYGYRHPRSVGALMPVDKQKRHDRRKDHHC